MLPHVTAGLSQATLRRIELASGELAATCLAEMERRQPWFGRLPADQRAGVLLVTQTGVANFVAWLGERGESIRLTAEAFRIAPHDLAQRLSLRQTVDLVRIATDVFEHQLPPLAADEQERHALVEGILRFGREIAFAAATVYAGAAETRGAWDARQEALVVDGVVRGETDHSWSPGRPHWAGTPRRHWAGRRQPRSGPREAGHAAPRAGRAGRSVLVGVQGSRRVGWSRSPARGSRLPRAVGHGVRIRPGRDRPGGAGPGRGARQRPRRAVRAARRTRVARAPRPVAADDLLPERALAGDGVARDRLVAATAPLSTTPELRRTLEVYLEGGGALEACARALFVHPNTVRYRLRRVSEITHLDPADPRDALVLRTAVIVGRLDDR